ncbi:hypothetical protein H4R34_005154 [Dimargaris verticillata]|uniref:Methyltransferase type 11 domain-containing protein n=1 Tax=Dimargaris verticillata TaxID=2761393 RepID=A0A9W8AZC5_9FUNG|nr:hypothetical protein H4R34_005154 [Dimargaris verticillata]
MATTSDERDWWQPEVYAKHFSFVPNFSGTIHALLKPYLASESELLDLGCGEGRLTVLFQSQCRRVVGVDNSPAMVEAARAAGCNDVRVGDGTDLDAAGIPANAFDVVFSNYALHWMKRDPAAVVRQVKRCLKPGGVFVAEFGAHMNFSLLRMALQSVLNAHGYSGQLHALWYLPTASDYKAVLENAGMEIEHLEWSSCPTVLPTDIRGVLDSLFPPFVECVSDPKERDAIFNEVVAMVKPLAYDNQGRWTVDIYCLRVVAKKPL